MRWISVLFVLFSLPAFSQWKDYKLTPKGDTINRIDQQGRKQWEWVIRYETVRGEPGFEEEGEFRNDRKEGEWRLFTLGGDLVGIEHYKWGLKDGNCQYYNIHGELKLEQGWKALNPDKVYDTIMVEDIDKLDSYQQVIVKNEGASIKHGMWKYYNTETGELLRSEKYVLGKLEGEPNAAITRTTEKKAIPKPKEVLDFEKKASGKKKIKYKDGSVGGY
ncbi:MAG TPA: hypothetical protein VM012_04685 [Flavitalea sp.]|nr:hypothetical protein [Flavitalea sp.]